MRKRFSFVLLLIFLFGLSSPSSAGIFEKAEYKSRRTKLMKSIPDGIALIIGSEEKNSKVRTMALQILGDMKNSKLASFFV